MQCLTNTIEKRKIIMTKQNKELLEDEFIKTLKMGIQVANIQADLLEMNMKDLDKKMSKLGDDMSEALK